MAQARWRRKPIPFSHVEAPPRRGTIGPISEPLQLTVVYEEGQDGFIIARVGEVPGAMSQGRTQEEARENVLDALRELVLSDLEEGESSPLPDGASTEPLRVTLSG